MTWEEKVASLEREVAELQSTVTKYDEWFQDQKMFCDCVGKFFKRQFGFDIWLQLDMLKSALGLGSSDSSEDSSSFFVPITSPRKRLHKFDYRTKASRRKQSFDGPGQGKTTSGGAVPVSSGASMRARTSSSIIQSPRISQPSSETDLSNRASSKATRLIGSGSVETSASGSTTDKRNKTNVTATASTSSSHAAEKSPEVSEVTGDQSREENTTAAETVAGPRTEDQEERIIIPTNHLTSDDSEDRPGDAPHVIKSESNEDYYDEGLQIESVHFPYHVPLAPPRNYAGTSMLITQRYKRGPTKRHSVWNYYAIYGNRAKCLVRGCDVEVKGVYPTNVLNHLKRHHPHVYNECMHEEWIRKNVANRCDYNDGRDETMVFEDPLA